jgi:3-oxoacyl-[acyl-carrier-protein] synthase III
MNRSMVVGTGSHLPARELTNAELEQMVDTSDEWITTRTGIKCRRIASRGEETSRIAAMAGRRALEMAGLAPEELDLIIVGTMTPEQTMPSSACLVQKELGAVRAFAFDINAACSGFIFSLDVADKYIRSSPAMKALVIGAENLSTRVNWKDRGTCILFGDGAGACVIAGQDQGRGVIGSRLFSDGRLWELLSMEAAPGTNPELCRDDYDGSYIRMTGRDVFRHAVRSLEDAVNQVLAGEGLTIDQVKMVIPHQANIRILNSLSERLGLPPEKIYINIHKYGNTSAASVPIALDEANREGRLQAGDLVLLCAFGGGFTWGATLLRW